MRKGADDDRDAHRRPRHNRNDSIPSSPAHMPHLKSPDAATAAARTPSLSPAIISTHRFPASIFPQYLIQEESHDHCSLLPRTPRPRLDLGPFTSQPRAAIAHRQRTHPQRPSLRRRPRRRPAGPPAGRHRRFGTDVAAAGGIGPALAAGLDPAGYPVVPGGVPQAWERAQVYLGLYERYQELYQAQVTELHLLMATAPGCSLPLSHRRPLTDPLTDTHTGYISLNCARLQQTKRKGQFLVQNGGSSRGGGDQR
jgi:hypothetical protein